MEKQVLKTPTFIRQNPIQHVERLSESEMKAKLKRMREKDRELVKGIFRYYEMPNGSLSFVYGKYKEDGVENYCLKDGEICTIPLGVARHLNKNGWYPVHRHQVTEDGSASVVVGQKVRRFGFQSLDFIDETEFEHGKDIIIVSDVIQNG